MTILCDASVFDSIVLASAIRGLPRVIPGDMAYIEAGILPPTNTAVLVLKSR